MSCFNKSIGTNLGFVFITIFIQVVSLHSVLGLDVANYLVLKIQKKTTTYFLKIHKVQRSVYNILPKINIT